MAVACNHVDPNSICSEDDLTFPVLRVLGLCLSPLVEEWRGAGDSSVCSDSALTGRCFMRHTGVGRAHTQPLSPSHTATPSDFRAKDTVFSWE
ncbi:mCG147511 [Mus musculus]|nr:mCG147511 [Mus musculus]